MHQVQIVCLSLGKHSERVLAEPLQNVCTMVQMYASDMAIKASEITPTLCRMYASLCRCMLGKWSLAPSKCFGRRREQIVSIHDISHFGSISVVGRSIQKHATPTRSAYNQRQREGPAVGAGLEFVAKDAALLAGARRDQLQLIDQRLREGPAMGAGACPAGMFVKHSKTDLFVYQINMVAALGP